MANTLFQFNAVKRGKEIKEFTISNLPQNAKIVIGPIMKVAYGSSSILPAVPSKAYLVHGVETHVTDDGTSTGADAYISLTAYDGSAQRMGFIAKRASTAGEWACVVDGINVLTQPNSAVSVSSSQAYTYRIGVVFYSEVDVVD